ncbi:MAG: sigma-70 family RNA polymerase sigma factor [Thermoanaerobaculia bacterium]
MALEELSAASPSDLVGRIRRGDRDGEDELVSRYRRGLAFILNRASGNTSTADDLLQDTFRIALEKIRRGDLREPDRLSGFLCALARNLVVDHFRKVAARRLPKNIENVALVSIAPDPLEKVLRTERATHVRRVLSELTSDRDREVLFRFYIAEDDKVAICQDLGLSSLHFNRVLFRARERYRELYRESGKKT